MQPSFFVTPTKSTLSINKRKRKREEGVAYDATQVPATTAQNTEASSSSSSSSSDAEGNQTALILPDAAGFLPTNNSLGDRTPPPPLSPGSESKEEDSSDDERTPRPKRQKTHNEKLDEVETASFNKRLMEKLNGRTRFEENEPVFTSGSDTTSGSDSDNDDDFTPPPQASRLTI